jgi:hypothetical protein
MQLELKREEQELLQFLLEERCQELHAEIRKTANHNFKEALKSKEHLIEGLLEKLSIQVQSTTA